MPAPRIAEDAGPPRSRRRAPRRSCRQRLVERGGTHRSPGTLTRVTVQRPSWACSSVTRSGARRSARTPRAAPERVHDRGLDDAAVGDRDGRAVLARLLVEPGGDARRERGAATRRRAGAASGSVIQAPRVGVVGVELVQRAPAHAPKSHSARAARSPRRSPRGPAVSRSAAPGCDSTSARAAAPSSRGRARPRCVERLVGREGAARVASVGAWRTSSSRLTRDCRIHLGTSAGSGVPHSEGLAASEFLTPGRSAPGHSGATVPDSHRVPRAAALTPPLYCSRDVSARDRLVRPPTPPGFDPSRAAERAADPTAGATRRRARGGPPRDRRAPRHPPLPARPGARRRAGACSRPRTARRRSG